MTDGKTAGRELGYGNVDARIDESPPGGGGGTFSQTGGEGRNAESGARAGAETEANAPGGATGKTSDDLK